MAWPCLPLFRIPETPCSPRLCLVVSRSLLVQSPVLLLTSVLLFLTLTHALTVYNTPPVVSALASNPNGEFVTVLCLRSHHCLTVSGSTGQWCPMMRTWECGRFLLRLPIRVPLCLPFGLATFVSVAAFMSPVPPDSSTHG